jgi:hypothetical protein
MATTNPTDIKIQASFVLVLSRVGISHLAAIEILSAMNLRYREKERYIITILSR